MHPATALTAAVLFRVEFTNASLCTILYIYQIRAVETGLVSVTKPTRFPPSIAGLHIQSHVSHTQLCTMPFVFYDYSKLHVLRKMHTAVASQMVQMHHETSFRNHDVLPGIHLVLCQLPPSTSDHEPNSVLDRNGLPLNYNLSVI